MQRGTEQLSACLFIDASLGAVDPHIKRSWAMQNVEQVVKETVQPSDSIFVRDH